MPQRNVEIRAGGRRGNPEDVLRQEVLALDNALRASVRPLKQMVLRQMKEIAAEMERKHGNPWPGTVASNADHLFRRSGAGLRSLRKSIRVSGSTLNDMAVSISPGTLSVHETGATIRPTRSKFLTVPLPAALTSRGTPLFKRARDAQNTFIARSRKGNLIIFRRESGGAITPLFLLKRQVTLKPRLGLGETFEKQLPLVERNSFRIIEREITRALGSG